MGLFVAEVVEEEIDWGVEADEEIVAVCDLSNPEMCETCS